MLVEICVVVPYSSNKSVADGGPRAGIGGCCGGPTKARCRFADGRAWTTRTRAVVDVRVVWSGYACRIMLIVGLNHTLYVSLEGQRGQAEGSAGEKVGCFALFQGPLECFDGNLMGLIDGLMGN